MRVFRLLPLFTALLIANNVWGAEVTYDFTATVSVVDDTSSGHTLIPSSIQPGSTETGSFSFDTSAPGSPFARGTLLDLHGTVTIDNKYTYTLTTPTTSDEIDVGLGGVYKRGPADITSFGAPISQLEFYNMTASSSDLSNVVFSMPGSVGISDANSTGQPYYFIGADMTSLAPSAVVPEPSALVGMGSALATFVGYFGWRRRKSTSC